MLSWGRRRKLTHAGSCLLLQLIVGTALVHCSVGWRLALELASTWAFVGGGGVAIHGMMLRVCTGSELVRLPGIQNQRPCSLKCIRFGVE